MNVTFPWSTPVTRSWIMHAIILLILSSTLETIQFTRNGFSNQDMNITYSQVIIVGIDYSVLQCNNVFNNSACCTV